MTCRLRSASPGTVGRSRERACDSSEHRGERLWGSGGPWIVCLRLDGGAENRGDRHLVPACLEDDDLVRSEVRRCESVSPPSPLVCRTPSGSEPTTTGRLVERRRVITQTTSIWPSLRFSHEGDHLLAGIPVLSD